MENMEISQQIKSTTLSVPSPTATHTACVNGARLQIRCLNTFEVVRNIALPSSHDLRSSKITWSPAVIPPLTSSTHTSSPTTTPPRRSLRTPRLCSNRVLISDDDTTRVYDLRDEKWNAVISNGSGGMGKNVHVEFGGTEDEVLVWTDFTACVKIWCLKTGRVVEIRDPKFPGKDGKGWGYRPADDTGLRSGRGQGRVLALLCRASGTDILLLLAPQTYKVLSRVELPTTDAAGLRWSRDGRWLAIWDAASAGYKLCIYTADGHLYRTIIREASEDVSEWDVEGLGIKSLEWVPGHERLAVGGWDRRVRILSTRTFAPILFLDHTPVIDVPSAPVYTEQVDNVGTRSFTLTPQPATPPKAALEKNENALLKQGIGMLSFNSEGTMCASRDDSTPCTVWIWDLRSLRPRSILIMYAPVKALLWHPYDPNRLLVQTTHDDPVVYLYTASQRSHAASASSANSSATTQHPPSILYLVPHIAKPAVATPARWTLSWLCGPANSNKKPCFALAHTQASVVVWPEGKDQILRFEHEDEEEGEVEEEGSDDSLYDILTGRTPVPGTRDSMQEEGFGDSTGTVQELDDTFRSRRHAQEDGGDVEHEHEHEYFEEGVLGDSGMSEMF
ncbi:hypothetical protein COCCADRAFT_31932 [Bipolaris zeicola 26-R-13]|uniref:Uncharacterized protein n=1 Tax=Cochliobolus carbonum (strain 26-R-13) TaxID=930089 RepID=W6Z6B8_COCC2|nr:uncharacterized protein COCCADRAFT_31932 [Bipolaris zeicola 26-R-13]EUC39216.1 hypothetical protein COCCADRAFT_31932 [Bipolaris zeicola 26-R-13]